MLPGVFLNKGEPNFFILTGEVAPSTGNAFFSIDGLQGGHFTFLTTIEDDFTFLITIEDDFLVSSSLLLGIFCVSTTCWMNSSGEVLDEWRTAVGCAAVKALPMRVRGGLDAVRMARCMMRQVSCICARTV